MRPDRILAGEYPGSDDPEDARLRLRWLLEAGVSTFIDLTVKGELEPYSQFLAEEAARFDTVPEYQRRPIRDASASTVESITEILDTIDGSVEAGNVVYLHCAAGIGRTGLVVGCYLVRHGASGEEALEEIARLRQRNILGDTMISPETAEQRNMVREWIR